MSYRAMLIADSSQISGEILIGHKRSFYTKCFPPVNKCWESFAVIKYAGECVNLYAVAKLRSFSDWVNLVREETLFD